MNKIAMPFADAPLAQRMLEISPAAVAVLDNRGTVVFVNGRLCDMLGFSREELVGNPTELFLPESLRDRLSQPACSLSHHAKKRFVEVNQKETVFAKNRDGSGVPVTVSVHEVNGSQQKFLLIHLIRAGQEPVDNHLLESERLAAIAQMVGGLAHESRNSLQKAVASLDLLELDLKSNPEQMVLSNRIRQSLSDLLENYDEVRRYAEPVIVHPERVKLLHLCQVAFNEMAVECEVFPHQLSFSTSSEHDDVAFVDREKLKSVFHHLLENAIDASSEVAIIEVDCTRTVGQDAGLLNLTVRDHGSGFDEASLKQAFEPFYTTKQQGTGLGLAICRRIIEAHGGNATAANHPAGGAAICLTLPITERRN